MFNKLLFIMLILINIYHAPNNMQGLTRDTLFLINPTLMVNYSCQPDWAMRCPDIWLNLILGFTVKCLDEIKISIDRISKLDCSP